MIRSLGFMCPKWRERALLALQRNRLAAAVNDQVPLVP